MDSGLSWADQWDNLPDPPPQSSSRDDKKGNGESKIKKMKLLKGKMELCVMCPVWKQIPNRLWQGILSVFQHLVIKQMDGVCYHILRLNISSCLTSKTLNVFILHQELYIFFLNGLAWPGLALSSSPS
ncbi:hypothetical protein SAY86_004944 [Trapa natans]|uniref:Uncharacterized protein n=1 Tax=Trapa natans TaxID=22666 RepID=A0AAN7L7T0_TRANT|nr:hypothetical protein SAY86_004944 [Trapa natans]